MAKKTKTVMVTMSPLLHRTLLTKAEEKGLSMAAYIRMLILESAEVNNK